MQHPRVLIFDRGDTFLFELDPNLYTALDVVEEVNGMHSLTITTSQELEKGMRVLVRDETATWHEWVVSGITETHNSHGDVVHEYFCVWSIQYDLGSTFVNTDVGLIPGHASEPHSALDGMNAALSGTARWTRGTIGVTTMAAASFYRRSGWEGLQTLVEKWGGEIEPKITLSDAGAITRKVNLLAQVGNATATRRFDYGFDVTSIKRTVSDDPLVCRIVPLGKSQQTENGGYTRRPTIESVNGGKLWLEDSSAVSRARVPDGSGGWEYPYAIVLNDTYEEPAELKAWALEHISEYTTPRVSYEADVAQFAMAGLDPLGVSLGDNVVVVDKAFTEDGLRIDARVLKMKYSLIDGSKVQLTIGSVSEAITLKMAGFAKRLNEVETRITSINDQQATTGYLTYLLDRINLEIGATGGYTYITETEGIRTYDVPVADPATGLEANQVVEIKGGTIRIANSKTTSGDWNWRTVFTSGLIATDVLTASNITTGIIGNASGGSYWDLDQNTLVIGTGANIGGRTAQAITTGIDDAAQAASDAAQAADDATTAANNAAQAADDAAQAADDARKVATNYLTYSASNGLDVGYSGTSARTNISGSGVGIYDEDGTERTKVGAGKVRIGKASGESRAEFDYHSLQLFDREGNCYLHISDLRDSSGYATLTESFTGNGSQRAFTLSGTPANAPTVTVNGSTVTNYTVTTNQILFTTAPASGARIVVTFKTSGEKLKAYTLGVRKSGSNVVLYSYALGYNVEASGWYSHAEGFGTKASGGYGSHAEGSGSVASGQGSHAEGYSCTASGVNAHAEGGYTEASGNYSHAEGYHTTASGDYQHVSGSYNVTDNTHLVIVGNGTGSRKNAMYLTNYGSMWIAGSLTQNSDRRLKEHHAYLGEDACAFVRALRPALYTKDGERHVGFYAQDVQEAEPDAWDTVTVSEQHTDESLDFDPLTLDYTALIAPLVAYAQQLERRVEQLEERLAAMEERLEAQYG